MPRTGAHATLKGERAVTSLSTQETNPTQTEVR